MKKILALQVIFIFVLAIVSCYAAEEPYVEMPYVSYTHEEITPAAQPTVYEVPEVTRESLVGIWILESQETEQAVFPRVIIFESGVKLLFGDDGDVSPFFWRIDGNVLSSHLLHDSVDMQIEFDADGALIFTYDDGLTATYVFSDYDLPEWEITPQLVGSWRFGYQTNEAELPDLIEFHPDGHGKSFCATGVERSFEWGIIYDVLLYKIFDNDVTAFIIHELYFEHQIYAFILAKVHYNELASFYFQSVEEPTEAVISLRGQTLYYMAAPENLTLFQFSNRYTFEQFFLVTSVFSWYDDVVHALLTGDLDAMSERVQSAWESQVMYFMVGGMPEILDDIPDDMELDEVWALINDMRFEIGLGDDHITGISFEVLDADTNAFIIELYDTQAAWLSTFIGIAFNETRGLSFFTSERVRTPDDEEVHLFCVIGTSSRGMFTSIDNTREAFVEHVRDAMDGTLGRPTFITER